MKILAAEQIRMWDEYTITNEPLSSIDLMERAAGKCTQWLEEQGIIHTTVRIFCGKGNNGGDGLAIARQLSDLGISPEVYILEFGAPGSNDFQTNLKRLHSHPVNIHFIQHTDFFPKIDQSDLIIDALFGSGLNRPLEGLSLALVQHINCSRATIVSIDLPSGMSADKANETEGVIEASYTLTFQQLKFGFLFPENDRYVGEVHVLDIGLHPRFVDTVSTLYELVDLDLIRQIYKPRRTFSHKGTFGHSLIIAGEKGKMGAAVLCAKGCLRTGTGLVSTMVPEQQFLIMQIAVPEAMVIPQELTDSVDWSKYSSIGLGPGIGTGVDGTGIVQEVLSHFNKPLVVDADGLNILATNQELLLELPPGSILTPHPKEFERLFGVADNHLERIYTARVQAQKLFVYIIVKGHYSFVACPDGEVFFNPTGNPGMATGGSGDVLTGVLTALLAQRYPAKEASILGMYLHGLAADIAIESVSQEALTAGDIINYLGNAFLSISH